MGKHLTDSVVEHQLKQQQKISQLQVENRELKQTSEEHQLKQQQMISQLQDENRELKQTSEEHQLKQQQMISQLQDENRELKQTSEEHQLKQQQMISQLQDENRELKQTSEEHQLKLQQLQDANKELKQGLVENEWLNSGVWNWCEPESSPLMMLSNCGRALLRVNSKQLQGQHKSKPFLANHSGYMATIVVNFSHGIVARAKPNHLLVYLMVSQGSSGDNKLTWPFKLRHTITLVDQQTDGFDVSMTIEPDKIDAWLAIHRFGHVCVPIDNETLTRYVEPAMFCVPLGFLSAQSYIKNNIVIKVEIDN